MSEFSEKTMTENIFQSSRRLKAEHEKADKDLSPLVTLILELAWIQDHLGQCSAFAKEQNCRSLGIKLGNIQENVIDALKEAQRENRRQG